MVDEFETDEEQNGPQALRDALKKAKDALAERENELKTLRAEKRQATLTESLKTKGLNPGVAKFVPEDADLDEWLSENAALFGVSGSGDGGQAEAEAPPEGSGVSEVEAGFQRVDSTVEGSAPRASVAPDMQGLLEASKRGPQAIADYMASLQSGRSAE